MGEIVNKIQQSKLETVDLERLLQNERIEVLDIRPFLFQELILREKEFRESLEQHDWSRYEGAWLAIHCTSDAIIPHWAWMLAATHAAPYAVHVVFGAEEDARKELLLRKIEEYDWERYRDRFVLLKGCSKQSIPPEAYVAATGKLLPIVDKLMYGEACSNVPVYRKPREPRRSAVS